MIDELDNLRTDLRRTLAFVNGEAAYREAAAARAYQKTKWKAKVRTAHETQAALQRVISYVAGVVKDEEMPLGYTVDALAQDTDKVSKLIKAEIAIRRNMLESRGYEAAFWIKRIEEAGDCLAGWERIQSAISMSLPGDRLPQAQRGWFE